MSVSTNERKEGFHGTERRVHTHTWLDGSAHTQLDKCRLVTRATPDDHDRHENVPSLFCGNGGSVVLHVCTVLSDLDTWSGSLVLRTSLWRRWSFGTVFMGTHAPTQYEKDRRHCKDKGAWRGNCCAHWAWVGGCLKDGPPSLLPWLGC